jgi:hypothetical protein
MPIEVNTLPGPLTGGFAIFSYFDDISSVATLAPIVGDGRVTDPVRIESCTTPGNILFCQGTGNSWRQGQSYEVPCNNNNAFWGEQPLSGAITGNSDSLFGCQARTSAPTDTCAVAVGASASASDSSVVVGAAARAIYPTSIILGKEALGGTAGEIRFAPTGATAAFSHHWFVPGIGDSGTAYTHSLRYDPASGNIQSAPGGTGDFVTGVGCAPAATVWRGTNEVGTTDPTCAVPVYLQGDGTRGNMFFGQGTPMAPFPGVDNTVVGASAGFRLGVVMPGSCNTLVGARTREASIGLPAVGSVAVGCDAAVDTCAVAVGLEAIALTEAVSVGCRTRSNGTSIAIGSHARSNAGMITQDAIAIGHSAQTFENFALAVGPEAIASGTDGAISIGHAALASASMSTAIGASALALGDESIAIGPFACGATSRAIAIGSAAVPGTGPKVFAGGYQSIAIGHGVTAGQLNTIGIGETVYLDTFPGVTPPPTYRDSIGIGSGVLSGSSTTIGMGRFVVTGVTADGSISLGSGVLCGGVPPIIPQTSLRSISLGTSVITRADDAITMGSGSRSGNAIGFLTTDPANSITIGTRAGALAAATSHEGAVTIGASANAFANRATVLGPMARVGTTAAEGAIAIGVLAGATGLESIAIGARTRAGASAAIAIGKDTVASGVATVAIGDPTTVSGDNSVGIGTDVTVTMAATDTIAMGSGALAQSPDSIVMGRNALGHPETGVAATSVDSIIIGHDAGSAAQRAVVIGYAASGQGAAFSTGGNVAIGHTSSAGEGSVAVGQGAHARAPGTQAVAVGREARVTAGQGIAIGAFSQCLDAGSVVIGHSASAQLGSDNSLILGVLSEGQTSGEIRLSERGATLPFSRHWFVPGIGDTGGMYTHTLRYNPIDGNIQSSFSGTGPDVTGSGCAPAATVWVGPNEIGTTDTPCIVPVLLQGTTGNLSFGQGTFLPSGQNNLLVGPTAGINPATGTLLDTGECNVVFGVQSGPGATDVSLQMWYSCGFFRFCRSKLRSGG